MTTPPRTTAAKLASAALRLLDPARLSEAIGRPLADVDAWANGPALTLEEQAALALAVIALAPADSPLVARALHLRDQVRASLAMQRRDTVTHRDGPPKWPR